MLDMKKKCVRGCPVDLGLLTLPPLYTAPLSIKSKKLEDLRQLLAYIPPVYHDFYNALMSSPVVHTPVVPSLVQSKKMKKIIKFLTYI